MIFFIRVSFCGGGGKGGFFFFFFFKMPCGYAHTEGNDWVNLYEMVGGGLGMGSGGR